MYKKVVKRQQGFSAVEALLLLVITGVIGFTGWWVWQATKSADSSYNNSAQAVSNLPKYSSINTFDDCKKAGGRIQESYPEVCVHGSKRFINNDAFKLTEKYINQEVGFTFKYPNAWKLAVNTEDIGTGFREGMITVTSPNGTIVHFDPNHGGKGGDCWDDKANARTPRICSTRTILSVQKIAEGTGNKAIYYYHIKMKDPTDGGGKILYYITDMNGEFAPTKPSSAIGPFLYPYGEIDTKQLYLTVYVEGRDDSKNTSPDFFNSREATEASPVLKSLRLL